MHLSLTLLYILSLVFAPLFSIAGGFNDTVDGGDGPDLVFGDHGEIELSNYIPYKLVSASTIRTSCTAGIDNITLGKGDDMAFGGK